MEGAAAKQGAGDDGATPDVTVVIPTRDREARLAGALEALAAQTLDSDRFEVIVVRHSGGGGARASAPDGLNVRFLESAVAGAATQRNAGWRAGTARLVAFTDDDCRPAPDWLERMIAADGGDSILQGRTEPDPRERRLLYGLARSVEVTSPSEWYETCNIAYPRELLERLGGFDESFPASWGEDTDLALRALKAGATRRYLDDALVWHAVVPRKLRDALRETLRYDSLALLIARHPAQRAATGGRLWVKESHAKLAFALLAGVALRRRPLLAVAAAIPYLRPHVQRHLATNPATPRSFLRLALHLPSAIAVELAELAVTVRGAIRHRVPLL